MAICWSLLPHWVLLPITWKKSSATALEQKLFSLISNGIGVADSLGSELVQGIGGANRLE
jgi:hypothetical protein